MGPRELQLTYPMVIGVAAPTRRTNLWFRDIVGARPCSLDSLRGELWKVRMMGAHVYFL